MATVLDVRTEVMEED